ncbi:MAG: DUF1178 family protein [Burkholderiaceae bacterium]|nr:DUF1178 family protein [Burkholderiaceae bacterium]
MKVLDLRCAHDHAFEGWFANEEDFQGQLVRGLLQCPVCGDGQIRKTLSAPRIQRSAVQDEARRDKSAVACAINAGARPFTLEKGIMRWASYRPQASRS